MAGRRVRYLVGGAVAALVLLVVAPCWLLWYVLAETATVWELPHDYRGWAVLEWENPACAPLPRHGLKRVASFDATGHACTSDRPEAVPSGEEWWLVGPQGRREKLRYQDFGFDGVQAYYGALAGGSDIPHRFSHVFIGTAADRVGVNPALVRPVCATPGTVRNECLR